MANDTYTADANGKVFAGRFDTTPLQDAFNAASAATWTQYLGTDINVLRPAYSVDREDIAVFETDELRKLTNWAGKWGYDRQRKKIVGVGTSEGYFAGAKNYRGKQVTFPLSTNSFTVDYGPLPLVNEGHIYDRNSSIPDSQGRFYCTALVSTGSPKLYRRDTDGNYTEIFTLSTANVPGMGSGNLLFALDVFPDLGSEGSVILFGQRGALVRYDIATSVASLLYTAATDNSHYYGLCMYVNGYIAFGGGQTTRQIYKLDSGLSVTAFADAAPHDINCQSGGYKYLPSPIDGENACYSMEIDTMRMYKHDHDLDSWTDIGAAVPVSSLIQTVFVPMRSLNTFVCFHGRGRVSGQDISEFWFYKVA